MVNRHAGVLLAAALVLPICAHGCDDSSGSAGDADAVFGLPGDAGGDGTVDAAFDVATDTEDAPAEAGGDAADAAEETAGDAAELGSEDGGGQDPPAEDPGSDGVSEDVSDDAADATTEPCPVWYLDFDEDGYGDANEGLSACGTPEGYVPNDDDCADDDADAKPGAVWYPDIDEDGYGDAEAPGTAQCLRPDPDAVVDHTDCNDGDRTQNPDTVWYRDADGDGFGDAEVSLTQCLEPALEDDYVRDDRDCVDDGDDAAAIFPGMYDCPFAPTGTSCLDIYDNGEPEGDGAYVIDPDGSGSAEPFVAYCDMTTDGGGWTALLNPDGFRFPSIRAPGFDIVLPNPGTSAEGWIEGTNDGCPGNVPGAFYRTAADGVAWGGYIYTKCGDLTIQMTLEWVNTLGATDVRFAAVLQGTPHRAPGPPTDSQCDSTPDSDGTIDTSTTFDADRDDYCGRREIALQGVEVAEDAVITGNDGNANGVQYGQCAYWNGDDAAPAEFPTSAGPSYVHPACMNPNTWPNAALRVFEDALDVDEDLSLRGAAGRGCWPNCGWNESIAIYGVSVR